MQNVDGKAKMTDDELFESEIEEFDDESLDAEFNEFAGSEKLDRIIGELADVKTELRTVMDSAATGRAEEKSGETANAEEIKALRAEVAALSARVGEIADDPDYSVMREVLALREEFQQLKDGLNDSVAALSGDRGVLAEVRTLRDQLFTISMAAVSDGEEQTYESYNNILVDEIGAVKDAIASILAIGTDGLKIDTSELNAKLDEVRTLVDEAKRSAEAQRDLATAEEIAGLKKTIAEQKETQASMLELMNKMIEKLDKQEEYTAKITDEIASTRSDRADREENNEAVMSEIKSIRQTLNVMQGNDNDADADLETSIGRLKAELSQMAGIIDGSAPDDPAE